MIKIYCIIDINGLRYVGSTTKKYLSQRLSGHRDKKNSCSSRLLDLDNCRIILLEECDDCDRKVKEQYWIDKIDCVNIINPVFNRKEWCEKYRLENKKYYSDKVNEWNKKNRSKINEWEKKRYHYKNSWGGDPRSNNNLLLIDPDAFKS